MRKNFLKKLLLAFIIANLSPNYCTALFEDNFNRPDNVDIDATSSGMSGSLAPLAYDESFEGSGSATSVQIISNQLQMAVGAGMSSMFLNHNFIDSDIITSGGFTISLDVVTINSSVDANRFGGFGVGNTLSEVQLAMDINDDPDPLRPSVGSSAPGAGVSDFYLDLALDGNLRTWNNGEILSTTNLGQASGNIKAIFYVTSFNSGSIVNVRVLFNDVLQTVEQFTWDNTNTNYIGISARASSFVDLDDLNILANDSILFEPINLTANGGDGVIDLDWDDNLEPNVTSYNVYRSLTSGTGYSLISNVASSSFQDNTVSNGTTYYYVVTALSSSTESVNSAEISGTPNDIIAPTNLNAGANDGFVTLNWNDNSEPGLTGYNVYRSVTSGSGYSLIANVLNSNYQDNTVTNGTTFYYVVTALSNSSESIFSGETFATPNFARPNVLIFMVDDLGYSDLSCYGGEVSTPNLDSLSVNGLQMTNFYVTPRCSPSRASLLTGLQSHQVGIQVLQGDNGTLPKNHVFLSEILQDNGYRTYMSGKWHLGRTNNFGNISGEIRDPRVRGFDHYYGFPRNHSQDTWNQGPYSLLSDEITPRSYVTENGDGSLASNEFYQTTALTDYALDFIQHWRDKNTTERSNNPFFMLVTYGAPHFPLQAPRDVVDSFVPLYTPGWDTLRQQRLDRMKILGLVPPSMILTTRSDVAGEGPGELPNRNNEGTHQIRAWTHPDIANDADRRNDTIRRGAVYGAMVHIMDQQIGRIFTDLQTNGEMDNTIIMFMSDNGACAEWHEWGYDYDDLARTGTALTEMGTVNDPGNRLRVFAGAGWANLSNTPYRNAKHYTHEGGIKTAMLVQWNDGLHGSLKGALSNQFGHVVDVLPTILGLLNLNYPTQYTDLTATTYDVLPHEGMDLSTFFETGVEVENREMGWEHENNLAFIRDGWKLVSSNFTSSDNSNLAGQIELYNLDGDQTEISDQASIETNILMQLIEAFNVWSTRIGAGDQITPIPIPSEPAPTLDSDDLFLDSYTRPDNDDIDNSSLGISGSLAPLSYNESFEGSGNSSSIQVDSDQLKMAVGLGMSNAYLEHNFIDASILNNAGFTVELNIALINSSSIDSQDRFIGFGVGNTLSQVQNAMELNAPNPLRPNVSLEAPGAAVSDFFIDLALDGNIRIWNQGDLLQTLAAGKTTGTLRVEFNLNDFNIGSSVNADIFLDNSMIGSQSFTWGNTGSNYIALSAEATTSVTIDNFRIKTGAVPVTLSKFSFEYF